MIFSHLNYLSSLNGKYEFIVEYSINDTYTTMTTQIRADSESDAIEILTSELKQRYNNFSIKLVKKI
mgnify:CR=1 FL=1